MDNLWILAQNETGTAVIAEPVTEQQTTTITSADGNTAPAAKQSTKPIIPPFLLIILMFVFIYFILFRGPQKQKKQRRQMVQSLQKNDKIQTIGGIIGTIVDIKDDEITLKIDETNNTKVKIAVSAIGRNFSKDKK